MFALVLLLAAQDPPSDLRWRLAAGDVLVYEHVVEQGVEVKGRDAPPQSLRIEATERLEVERVTVEGEFVVRRTVARLRLASDGQAAEELVGEEKAPEEAIVLGPLGGVKTKDGSSRRRFLNQALGLADPAPARRHEALDLSPLAALALPLPRGKTEDAWSDEETGEQGGCRIAMKITCRRRGFSSTQQDLTGEVTVRMEGASPGVKLRDGSVGSVSAVFDVAGGYLREAETKYAIVVESRQGERVVQVASTGRMATRLASRTRR